MFVVTLKFSDNRDKVGQYMDSHKTWVQQGFDDSVFLLAGSLQPSLGGALLAHNTSLEELEKRVSKDPFVAEKVVTAEILEIDPARADERLGFLIE